MCQQVVLNNLPKTILELEKRFEEFERKSKREAAEIAFAIARYYGDSRSRFDRATTRKFGLKSIELFEQCEMQTMQQCGTIHDVIAGVVLPDLIHEGVVRFRAKTEWGIDLG